MQKVTMLHFPYPSGTPTRSREIKEILADFTEKTGIKTEISVVKWDEYWTMLEAGAQGGSLPDVFWMHSNESRDTYVQRYAS